MSRPTVKVYAADGTATANTLALPAVFNAPVRADVVRFVHKNVAKNKRQAYAVSVEAGHQTSAESWGTGRAVARIPRVSGGGTHRAGQAAFGNFCRGGRMFAPTKVWRKWHIKTNQNQKRYATASAIAASGVTSLVQARGHKVEGVSELPLVVDETAFAGVSKSKQAVALLKALGAYADVEKVAASRTLRSGRGKIRNRRYVQRRGPLIVFNEANSTVRAFRNLPGVELCHVSKLNILQLAPGAHVGRFIIWTSDAFAQLDTIYGTPEQGSELKKGFRVPRPLMTNPDVNRIVRSAEVQAAVRPEKVVDDFARFIRVKKNPLKNTSEMARLNPHAVAHKRAEILLAEKNQKIKKAAPKKVLNKDYIATILKN